MKLNIDFTEKELFALHFCIGRDSRRHRFGVDKLKTRIYDEVTSIIPKETYIKFKEEWKNTGKRQNPAQKSHASQPQKLTHYTHDGIGVERY